MALRCPESTYLGIAKLTGWRWIINERGYANVVERTSATETRNEAVWGMVYSLSQSDEAQLDINEGVPDVYGKEYHQMRFWPTRRPRLSTSFDSINPEIEMIDLNTTPQYITGLVYVDRYRTKPSKPKAEYVYRMNMGMKDATAAGVPSVWFEDAVRPFVPSFEDENGDGTDDSVEGRRKREATRQMAEQQAGKFVEEDER